MTESPIVDTGLIGDDEIDLRIAELLKCDVKIVDGKVRMRQPPVEGYVFDFSYKSPEIRVRLEKSVLRKNYQLTYNPAMGEYVLHRLSIARGEGVRVYHDKSAERVIAITYIMEFDL